MAARPSKKHKSQTNRPQAEKKTPSGHQKRTATPKGARSPVGDELPNSIHPFIRWQTLVRDLNHEISTNLLPAIRSAMASAVTVAAKVFLAWRTSRLPECQELVIRELSQTSKGTGGVGGVLGVRRFVAHLFHKYEFYERRNTQLLRSQIIATAEKLDWLEQTGQWKVLPSLGVPEVTGKIAELGGITRVYDDWRRQEIDRGRLEKREQQRARAETMGVEEETLRSTEQAIQDRHRAKRREEMWDKFSSMLPNISEDLSWKSEINMALVAITRKSDGTMILRMLKSQFSDRMVAAVVAPVNPIS